MCALDHTVVDVYTRSMFWLTTEEDGRGRGETSDEPTPHGLASMKAKLILRFFH
jgi:hypothetical protein